MFFDRYEIHIQAFVDFTNGKLIIFNPDLHNMFFKKYILRATPSAAGPHSREEGCAVVAMLC